MFFISRSTISNLISYLFDIKIKLIKSKQNQFFQNEAYNLSFLYHTITHQIYQILRNRLRNLHIKFFSTSGIYNFIDNIPIICTILHKYSLSKIDKRL